MARWRDDAGEEGFSLIELLVVVSLMTIIGGAIVSGLVTGYRTMTMVDNRVTAVTDLQTAMEYVGRHVRVADSEGAGAIRPSTPTRLSLDVYLDDAGTLTRVRYTYEMVASTEVPGRMRMRETRARWINPNDSSAGFAAATTRFLVDGVDTSTPVFTYFDDAGSVVADPSANVASVEEVLISISRSTRDLRNPDRSVDVSTRVTLRNAGL